MNYIAERSFLFRVLAVYVFCCLCTVCCLCFLQGLGHGAAGGGFPLVRIMGEFVDVLLFDKDDGS